MKPAAFEYRAPASVAEAVELLAQLGEEAKVLAGGQSLLPLLNLRLAQPAYVIDVNGVTELALVRALNGELALGAMVRQRAAERSDAVLERCPLLAEALPLIGHLAIRTRGTIGGSLAHADPAAELPVVALALEAELVLRSARGDRTLGAGEFFLSYLTTALEPDEILLEVRLPARPKRAGSSFQETSRRHGDFALVGVATMVGLDAEGVIADARLAFSGVDSTPVRAREAESMLIGERPSREALRAAAERAAADLEPSSDIHASAAYRRHLASVLARRSLEVAVGRAEGH